MCQTFGLTVLDNRPSIFLKITSCLLRSCYVVLFHDMLYQLVLHYVILYHKLDHSKIIVISLVSSKHFSNLVKVALFSKVD